MDFTKFVLLFCLISISLCTRQTQGYVQPNTVDEPKNPLQWLARPSVSHPNYGFFRRMNKLTNNLRQCFCFLQKPTGIPVTQKLNPGDENLERLVLYLYRDTSSADIKLYLPNIEKQHMIPDLAFDDGDRLETLSAESAEALFTTHSELVTDRDQFNTPDIAYIRPEKVNKKVNTPGLLDILEASLPKELIFINEQENPVETENIMNPGNEAITNGKNKQIRLDFEHVTYKTDTENRTGDNLNVVSQPHNIVKEDETIQTDIDLEMDYLNSFPEEPEMLNLNYVKDHESEEVNTSTDEETEQLKLNLEFDLDPEDYEVKTDVETEQPNVNLDLNSEWDLNVIADDETENENFNLDFSFGSQESSTISESVRPKHELDEPEDLNIITKYGSVATTEPNLEKDPKPDNLNIIVEDGNNRQKIELNHKPEDFKPRPDLVVEEIYKIIEKPNAMKYKKPTLISLNNVNKDLMTSELANGKETPTESFENSKKQVLHSNALDPRELSLITLHPQRLVKKHQKSNQYKPKELKFRDKFDVWFNDQLKRVHFDDSEVSNSIDIHTFKYLIEKTLHDSGLFITEKGFLLDLEGNFFDLTNIKMRPILIGNSVEYKNLLQGKLSSFTLPTGMPYLEAVLITSINPQKILGIIPLGKTYLPKSYRKPLALYIEDEQSPIRFAKPNCDRACKIRKYLMDGHRHNPAKRIGTQQHELFRPIPNKPVSSKLSAKNNYRKLSEQPPKISNIRYDSQEVFPFDQVKTIINRYHNIRKPQDKTEFKHGNRDFVLKLKKKPVTTVIEPKYPVVMPKVKPGFRIIGGNAATSSGTPLSTKGRSGYISSEINYDFSDDYAI